MRRAAIAWVLGVGIVLVVGAAVGWFPHGWVPEPGIPVVIAMGLRLTGIPGMLTAWFFGWACDLLSGAPFGQYAFLYLVAWLLTRAAERQVELRRGVVLVGFGSLLCVLEALAVAGLRPLLDPGWISILLPHAVLTGLATPMVVSLLDAALERFDPREALRASLRLDPGPAR